VRLLAHILQFKVLSFAKTTFDFRPIPMVRGIASLLVFGGFAVVAYLFAHELTQFVLEKTKTGLFLYHRFISMILFVFFVAVNLGNIIVSYATLYRSAEVRYLLTKPIPYSNIFILKFLDNFLYSSTTLFLIALAVLGGYGTYFGYSWTAIIALMAFVLIPFMFLSASLAVMILMAIIKIAGRWGFRRVMTVLAGIYLLGIYLFFKFTNPIKLVEEVFQYYPNVNFILHTSIQSSRDSSRTTGYRNSSISWRSGRSGRPFRLQGFCCSRRQGRLFLLWFLVDDSSIEAG